jgi:hypothetical protein
MQAIKRAFFFFLVATMVLFLGTSRFSQAASAPVPETGAGDHLVHSPILPDYLKPPECASLNLDTLIVGSGVITGTDGNDLILGGASADAIDSLGGDDCVVGGAGDDTLLGGTAAVISTLWDQFNAVSYSNNDGTQPWSNDWQEIGESDGPFMGDVNVEVPLGRGSFTILASADAHLEQANPDLNFGAEVRLRTNPQPGNQRQSMLYFDLAAIPPGSNVVSAQAYFYVRNSNTSPVNVHRVTASWSETTATWNNSAWAYDPSVMGAFTPAINRQFVSADITTLAQGWVNGAYPNYGLMLVASPAAGEARFSSREANGALEAAFLLVEISQGGGANTLYASEDTHVDQATPNANFALDNRLRVKPAAGDQKRSLVRFDLSAIPPGYTVQSASASFYVRTNDNRPVSLHRITAAWSENAATWNNSASAYEPAASASFTPSVNRQYVTVDITALANGWVTGSYPNYGLMLIAASGATESRYSSLDVAGTDEDPYLTLVLSTNGPAQGLRLQNASRGAWRQADLTNAASALLEFSVLRQGLDDANDTVALELSSDGGASWTEVARYSGPADDAQMQAASLDISAFIAANTALRFIASPNLGAADRVYFDAVKITYSLILPVALDDILLGGAGDDELDGEAGVDICFGGDQNDQFWDCEILFDP